jgi:16S rRNA (guanine527-N7)-methyltransferase
LLKQKWPQTAIDLGSGAGFPGVPFAILAPDIQVTLIESQQKKAAFLRELVRVLELRNTRVFNDRAENYEETADLVMLRAVEKFEQVLPMALRLIKQGGRIALMIGSAQVDSAKKLGSAVSWYEPMPIPCSSSRELLVGVRA